MHARFIKEALRREAARQRPELVWIAAPDGNWIELNESWTALTGRAASQSLGYGWLDCLAPAQRPEIEQQWRAALAAGAALKLEIAVVCADGREQAMRLESRPVRSDEGELHGYVGHLEIQSETEAQLHAALQQAQTALAVHDQFLATISHELRSPLSGIQSWAYVLERTVEGAPTSSVQRALAGIKTGVQQQVKLIDDLLDAAYVMSVRMVVQCEPLTPQDLLEEAVARLQVRFDEKQIQLHRQIDASPGQVNGDRGRLVQVLENILSNAIRFSEQGGTVVAAIQMLGDEVRIAVTDYGKGIAAHRLPLLRNPYVPRDEAGTGSGTEVYPQPFSSIGMKLTLTRRLLALHGGRLTLASEGEGRGAEFAVYFPLLGAV